MWREHQADKNRPAQGKTKVQLDSKKSEQSLAQIYEDQYMKQAQGVEKVSVVQEEHEAISKMFEKICFNLDALTHFHYTPKPVEAQPVIKANIPSMMMEEQLPEAVADTSLLAPQEVQQQPLTIKSKDEYTPEERKALRRRIKEKVHKKAAQKREEGQKPKDTKEEALKTLRANKQVVVDKDNRHKQKELLSSKAFFGKLQAEVESGDYNKQAKKKPSSSGKTNKASTFKL